MPLQRLEPYAPKGARTVLRGPYRSNAVRLPDQDHRNIKSRVNAMLGFKRFRSAAITISGVELMHRIRKGQFNLERLRLKDATAPAVWKAVLSAR
jgi:transposase-like protein